MDDLQANAIIEEACRAGFGQVYARGHRWVNESLRLALLNYPETTAPGGRVAGALAWYVLGDVLDCNRAPRAAIGAYSRSIALVPTHASAWREKGVCELEIGRPESGVESLRRALSLDPEDAVAHTEHEAALSGATGPRYTTGDRLWNATEALAVDEPRRAASILARPKSVQEHLWRTSALSMAGCHPDWEREWATIAADAESRVVLDSSFWFYLPESHWRSRSFWHLLGSISERLGLERSPFGFDLCPVRRDPLSEESPADVCAAVTATLQ